ncbi:hypothetical protein HRED_06048, partial [Candidatus Haloredivivus sp. G17]
CKKGLVGENAGRFSVEDRVEKTIRGELRKNSKRRV